MPAADPLGWSIDCLASPQPAGPSPAFGFGSNYQRPTVERSIDGSGGLADPIPAQSVVVRRWDAAQTDRLNEAHWAGATGQPIDHDLAVDLPMLRARTAHEIANNPIVEGVVNTHATDLVGPDGPSLQVRSDNDVYNNRLEAYFREWADLADLNGEMGLPEILQLWDRQIWSAGSLLAQEVTSDIDDGFPVRMRLNVLHANRLATPWTMTGDPNIAFGIRRTRSGRPLTYYITEPRHNGPYQYETGETTPIPADLIYHGFIKTEPGQTVGYPLLASALPAIADLRDYDTSVLDAARSAADRADWFINLNPDGEKFQADDGFSVTHKRRVTRAAPPGWDVKQLAASQPTAHYVEHRRERMAEIGRAAAMPLMLIRLDSSQHNYSSARFDHQMYIRHLRNWQSWMARRFLNRMVKIIARELQLAGELPPPPPGVRYTWTWTPPPQVDPTKERGAERLGLMNRTLTFAEACLANNRQEEDVIASWAGTLAKLQKAGFTDAQIVAFLQGITSKSGGPTGTPNTVRKPA